METTAIVINNLTSSFTSIISMALPIMILFFAMFLSFLPFKRTGQVFISLIIILSSIFSQVYTNAYLTANAPDYVAFSYVFFLFTIFGFFDIFKAVKETI